MSSLAIAVASAQGSRVGGMFSAPWDVMDDAALLVHFRAPRAVRYYPVADAEETRPEKITAILRGVFEFNGETHVLPDPVAWLDNPSRDVEWHILLHKFYYAVGLGQAFAASGEARYARRWSAMIDSWMRVTPPGFIAADVTGRRVQNWIYSYHHFVTHAAHDAGGVIGAAFHRRLLCSLHDQVEFLCANLTPKRNHRTLELYAIFLAGVVFPEMRRAAFWREFALNETVANMAADLLPDGVHCELSTDYHHLVLKNYLNFRRLAVMNDIAIPAAMDAALVRALEFSLHVHKPDGVVPSLSDGDARGFLELLEHGAEIYKREDMRYVATRGARGQAPAQRVAHFPDSGYSIVRSGWGTGAADFADAQYLVFDSGPLGEGNHGHFDALSFELAAFGRSLIVDPGRFTYSEALDAEGVNWRVHFRGTNAHNTVCIDGRQQTRYAPKAVKEPSRHAHGAVRHKISGPAAEAKLIEHFHGPHFDLLHGRVVSHEYDAVHERAIVFIDRCYWIVSDWLTAQSEHDYALNFQLGTHAQGQCALETSEGVRLMSPGLLLLQPALCSARHELRASWVSQRYGDKRAAPALTTALRARDVEFDTVLAPWQSAAPDFGIRKYSIKTNTCENASNLLRVDLRDNGACVTDYWLHIRAGTAFDGAVRGFTFSGRWLYWREAADGRVLRAASHAGAELVHQGAAVTLMQADPS